VIDKINLFSSFFSSAPNRKGRLPVRDSLPHGVSPVPAKTAVRSTKKILKKLARL